MNRLSTIPSLTLLTILQGCAVSHGDMSRHVESAHADGDHMNPVAQTTLGLDSPTLFKLGQILILSITALLVFLLVVKPMIRRLTTPVAPTV